VTARTCDLCTSPACFVVAHDLLGTMWLCFAHGRRLLARLGRVAE
jgi:hypothetical protein